MKRAKFEDGIDRFIKKDVFFLSMAKRSGKWIQLVTSCRKRVFLHAFVCMLIGIDVWKRACSFFFSTAIYWFVDMI